MNANDLRAFYEERFGEIEAYLSLLEDIEVATRSGPPRIRTAAAPISAAQLKILNSSLYLQLYNLVEATVSRCLDAVISAVDERQWRLPDLNLALRGEWVRAAARTHINLTPEHRLKSAVAMCEHLLAELPISKFEIEVGGGGNWDDTAIEAASKRVGCDLKITAATKKAVKSHFRDDMGALKLVKDRRNRLAHGSLSFVECSDGVSVSELRILTSSVGLYLREAIECFIKYIETGLGVQPVTNSTGVA